MPLGQRLRQLDQAPGAVVRAEQLAAVVVGLDDRAAGRVALPLQGRPAVADRVAQRVEVQRILAVRPPGLIVGKLALRNDALGRVQVRDTAGQAQTLVFGHHRATTGIGVLRLPVIAVVEVGVHQAFRGDAFGEIAVAVIVARLGALHRAAEAADVLIYQVALVVDPALDVALRMGDGQQVGVRVVLERRGDGVARGRLVRTRGDLVQLIVRERGRDPRQRRVQRAGLVDVLHLFRDAVAGGVVVIDFLVVERRRLDQPRDPAQCVALVSKRVAPRIGLPQHVATRVVAVLGRQVQTAEVLDQVAQLPRPRTGIPVFVHADLPVRLDLPGAVTVIVVPEQPGDRLRRGLTERGRRVLHLDDLAALLRGDPVAVQIAERRFLIVVIGRGREAAGVGERLHQVETRLVRVGVHQRRLALQVRDVAHFQQVAALQRIGTGLVVDVLNAVAARQSQRGEFGIAIVLLLPDECRRVRRADSVRVRDRLDRQPPAIVLVLDHEAVRVDDDRLAGLVVDGRYRFRRSITLTEDAILIVVYVFDDHDAAPVLDRQQIVVQARVRELGRIRERRRDSRGLIRRGGQRDRLQPAQLVILEARLAALGVGHHVEPAERAPVERHDAPQCIGYRQQLQRDRIAVKDDLVTAAMRDALDQAVVVKTRDRTITIRQHEAAAGIFFEQVVRTRRRPVRLTRRDVHVLILTPIAGVHGDVARQRRLRQPHVLVEIPALAERPVVDQAAAVRRGQIPVQAGSTPEAQQPALLEELATVRVNLMRYGAYRAGSFAIALSRRGHERRMGIHAARKFRLDRGEVARVDVPITVPVERSPAFLTRIHKTFAPRRTGHAIDQRDKIVPVDVAVMVIITQSVSGPRRPREVVEDQRVGELHQRIVQHRHRPNAREGRFDAKERLGVLPCGVRFPDLRHVDAVADHLAVVIVGRHREAVILPLDAAANEPAHTPLETVKPHRDRRVGVLDRVLEPDVHL